MLQRHLFFAGLGLVVLSGFSCPAWAGVDDPIKVFESEFISADDPIDVFESECISKDSTTAGMNNCTAQARDRWDAEMNLYYQKLMKILNKEEREQLRAAQRAWLKFRDEEFRAIAKIYERVQGTMYSNIRSAYFLAIVKERARTLRAYYHVRSIAGP